MIERTYPFSVLEPYTREHATELVRCINRFTSSCHYLRGTQHINGRSLLGVLTIMACGGERLTIRIDGHDEKAAFQAIEELLLKTK